MADEVTTVVCEDELQEAVDLFHVCSVGSVVYTIVVYVCYNFLLKERIEGAPGLASQFYTIVGSIKLFIALSLFTVLQPQCPEGCTCTIERGRFMIYPTIALLVALSWYKRAYQRWQVAKATTTEEDREAVFDKVSTVELA